MENSLHIKNEKEFRNELTRILEEVQVTKKSIEIYIKIIDTGEVTTCDITPKFRLIEQMKKYSLIRSK